MKRRIHCNKNIGALAVIGLFMFLAVASLDEVSEKAPPSSERAAVGKAVQLDGLEVKVTSVSMSGSVGKGLFKSKASEGGVYVMVNYSIKNTSTKPVGSFSQPVIYLVSPEGTHYDADIEASGAYATEANLDEKVLSDLNPGITMKGSEVYEISKELFDLSTWSVKIETFGSAAWFNLK